MIHIIKGIRAFFLSVVIYLCLYDGVFHVNGQQPGGNNDSNTDQSTNNIAFDLPDITATFATETGTAQLEAYKSVNNDLILRDTSGRRTSELFWVSVGIPNFIKTPNPLNQTDVRLFHFSNRGFSTYVQTMTDAQRRVLASAARSKYRVEISDNQVVNLVLSSFQCSLILYDDVGKKYLLSGKVSDFRNFPLRMDFIAPQRSNERSLFLEQLGSDESRADFQFECGMESAGKLMKTNTLMISGDQLQQIGLEEKLFGPAGKNGSDSVYVTRDQMTSLSSEMYTTLNIVEDYQMPEIQFSEAFITGLIEQLAISQFTQTPIDTVLASLSKYGFDISADLQPDVIKKDVGSILQVKQFGSNERIILNETNYRQFIEKQSNSGGGGAGFLGFKASAKWGNNNEKTEITDNRSLSDQLRELNTASTDEAQWTFEGNRVVPKTLNVARLSRSRLSKTLIFNRVRIQSFNSAFQRKFTIYTVRARATVVFLEELTSQVKALQNATTDLKANHETLITGLRVDLNGLRVDHNGLAVSVQALTSTVNQGAANVQSQIQQLNTAVEKAQTDVNFIGARAVRRCRICFQETEGSSQCQGTRNSCSGWSDAGSVWTQVFRDDTDGRPGGCYYQWVVECQTA